MACAVLVSGELVGRQGVSSVPRVRHVTCQRLTGLAVPPQVVPRAVHLYHSGPLQGPGGSADSDDEADEYTLVSGHEGSVESLPLSVRKVLHALKHNQEKLDALVRSCAPAGA